MTDLVQGYLVTLDKDMREDDTQAVISAISMVRGVLSVEPIKGKGFDIEMATARTRHELMMEIFYLINKRTK